jgi:hypothetical protein
VTARAILLVNPPDVLGIDGRREHNAEDEWQKWAQEKYVRTESAFASQASVIG